jgi:non-ribosomal peptide synthetase component E (peptide arylation enzyme)
MLLSHPKVAAAALVGLPDDRLGERICAFVEPRDPSQPPELAELVEHLRAQQVARFKWPERLEVLAELPRNPVGKILKRSLRERLRDAASV